MTRTQIVWDLWWFYNEDFFGWRLSTPVIRITRARSYDGQCVWYHNSPKVKISIARYIFEQEEGVLEGTLLHEMIHQWEYEVRHERDSTHEEHTEWFAAEAKRAEEKYGIPVS